MSNIDEALLDTPIAQMTPRQLMGVLNLNTERRRFVSTLKELAEVLGASYTTVWRMSRDGLLGDAVTRYGKWVRIDVDRVLENLRKANKKNKINR